MRCARPFEVAAPIVTPPLPNALNANAIHHKAAGVAVSLILPPLRRTDSPLRQAESIPPRARSGRGTAAAGRGGGVVETQPAPPPCSAFGCAWSPSPSKLGEDLEGEAGADPEVASGERRKVLEEARVPPRLDVEDVVRREQDGAAVLVAERMEGERRVDHRIAVGRRLEIGGAVLLADPFDLDPAVDPLRLGLEAAEQPDRRDARRRSDVHDRRP